MLGIKLDENITWNDHIALLSQKLSSTCYAMKTIKSICSQETVMTLYYASVYTTINYGVIFWGNSSKWSKIFKLQKRIIRIIFNLQNTESCRSTFQHNKILTLPAIYIYSTILFATKNIQYNKNSDIHEYYTRSTNKNHVTHHKTKKFEMNP